MQRLDYPETSRQDAADDYHGTTVADPYRWLEDPNSPETQAWVAAQNRLTRGFLDAVPARQPLAQRLTELWDFPKYGTPWQVAGRTFFWKNTGLQPQSVLYVQPSLDAAPVAILDPNALSEDGTTAVTAQRVAEDGRLLAYGVSHHGSDWQELHVRDVDAGADLPDAVQWCKFTSIAWAHDGAGFYYSRFPEPGSVPPEDQSNFQRVCWHRLGSAQTDDRLIYERPDAKELGFSPIITDDGKYLVLHVWHGTDPTNRIYYRPAGSDDDFVRLLDAADARYDFVDNVGTVFYFNTDKDAPRGRIIAIDVTRPEPEHWREVLPEPEETLDSAAIVNDHLVAVYMKDAHHEVRLYTLQGEHVRDVALPAVGSVVGLTGRRIDREFFLGFTSILYPTSTFRYDFHTGRLDTFQAPQLPFDTSRYETRQAFCTSMDGTRVPLFLTHRKGLALDGNNPTLVYGYGGFNVSLTPSFSVARLVWLEQGGVYAQANLRGGSEYGEAWHQAGMLERKQNVFDDFIAAAEWLIASKVTRPERLAIQGGSNGGLLVASCLLQRPDLYGAVLCQVPVADMLRYHRFTVGRYWTGEYGNAEADPAHFRFLYAYSPLHNVRPGTAYPPTLITSADTDDRVVPAHAKKLAATLQAAQAGDAPILIRVETRAGHGAGKPTAKVIEEQADLYAFLFATLGMECRSPSGAT